MMRHVVLVSSYLINFIIFISLTHAQEIQVPLHVQSQFYKKIFAYSLTIPNSSNPTIAIIAPSHDAGENVKAAFAKSGMTEVNVLTSQEFLASSKRYDVAYLCTGVRASEVSAFCQSKKILTVTGSVEVYDAGKIGIGLKLHEGKCQILLNMDEVKKEGHRFSAAFLNLTKSR
ncbi:MAG TPA: YfiR/HmsC family protein [bacterium]|nr:YfiR/HmsC family protein [bacterium]